jgi:hypothetical protein
MTGKGKLFVLWIAGLLFALCPLIFDWIHRLYERNAPPLVSLIIHGEVVIISVARIADTFVRTVKSSDTKRHRLPLMIGCPIALLLLGFDAGQLRETVAAASQAFTDPFV